MKMQFIFIALFCIASLFVGPANCSKRFLVLTNIHYNPNHTDTCIYGQCLDYGRYGKTTSRPLLQTVLKKALYEVYETDDISELQKSNVT